METVENTLVVGGILWLVQAILHSLSSVKLDEWIRQVGLAEDAEKLRTEIERVKTVVAAVQGRATGNEPLARSLARLRDLMYDADDAVDELDYFRLQQQVEGGATVCANTEPEGADLDGAEPVVPYVTRDNPNIPSTSNSKKRKNRSWAWDHFVEKRDVNGRRYAAECKRCGAEIQCNNTIGTNGLTKHLGDDKKCLRKPAGHHQPIPTSDDTPNGMTDATLRSVISERMITSETSMLNITPSRYHWNKAASSEKIHRINCKLQDLRETVTDYLKDSVGSSDQYRINTLDTRLRTTSLVLRKVYGRDKDKDYIIRVITGAESDVVTVLPIVGIAGVGKTALAQLVYNDLKVESQFERIWVCVSYDFDEVRVTREMLDFFQERNEGSSKIQYKHQGISGLGRLQEILKEHMQCQTKRFLLILDDVWQNLYDEQWKRLLVPLQSGHAKGNVILVTTRDLSVAQRIGTEEPIKLGALEKNVFWLLYKSFAFGDDNYGEIPSLNNIGQQIAERLKGNPLAAETAGKLLRQCLNREHWDRILKNEDWKSLQLRGGIMSALKLSYDQLPYQLKPCFLYCSIFPDNYLFSAKDLVCAWISLGYVRCINSREKLEEIGRKCLTDLVNLGFLEQVERTRYAIHGIMHDFGRLISGTEYATIDSLEFNKPLLTMRHLSIVSDSAYLSDQHGTIVRDEKFKTNLQSMFQQARKLRTLVLLGNYDTFFRSFQDILHEAQNLRVLQISAKNNHYSLMDTVISPVHLRHLKLQPSEIYNDFYQTFSKLYHLQVLDLDKSRTNAVAPMYMDNLVSLIHLEELNCTGSDVTKLQSMSELVQLGVYNLRDVTTRDRAYGARLKDKANLEKLRLSWGNFLPPDEYDSDNYWMSEYIAAATTSDVFEGLEPHCNLKHLQVLGYSGAESPGWLGSSVSHLQTLHLEDCGEWEGLRFLGSLPFLTKLKLRNMQKVEDISIPSLEELMLIDMPKLEKCSCDSVRDLNSSLRVLKIVRCRKLKVFPLFGSCGIEQKSWLFHLRELTILCSDLAVPYPLPPSSSSCKLSIQGVSDLPAIKGISYEELSLWSLDGMFSFVNRNILAFHNLRVLCRLTILNFDYPIFSLLDGFRQLINLKSLRICSYKNHWSPNLQEEYQTYENMSPRNINALPSLKTLMFDDSSVELLSVLLRNVPALEELTLDGCTEITGLLIGNEESELSDPKSASVASSSGDAVIGSFRHELVHISSKLISSIKKMSLRGCSKLTCQGNEEGFSKLTSLEELCIDDCPELVPSCVHKDKNDEHANGRWLLPQSLVKLEINDFFELETTTLRLCFPGNVTGLKRLELKVWGEGEPRLESLQLQYCTALEELLIDGCETLTALEGLPSLGGFRSLEAFYWPHLVPYSERLLSQGYDIRPRLVHLKISSCSVVTTSFCRHLKSLQRLEFSLADVRRLTDEQESALQLLTSLQELRFSDCISLEDLPVGLHSPPSLKKLYIEYCPRLSRLPEKGLPNSLEELDILLCRKELTDQCTVLATSKLKVQIYGWCVNG